MSDSTPVCGRRESCDCLFHLRYGKPVVYYGEDVTYGT